LKIYAANPEIEVLEVATVFGFEERDESGREFEGELVLARREGLFGEWRMLAVAGLRGRI
jgi:hypothetical protein